MSSLWIMTKDSLSRMDKLETLFSTKISQVGFKLQHNIFLWLCHQLFYLELVNSSDDGARLLWLEFRQVGVLVSAIQHPKYCLTIFFL